jgi:hypothetical protein
MSFWGWFWCVLAALAALVALYGYVIVPWLDEHERRTRAFDAAEAARAHTEREAVRRANWDATWADAGEAAKAAKFLHEHWDDVTKRGPK